MLPERDIRDACRKRLEATEQQLRRVVHDRVSNVFGADLATAQHVDTSPIIGKALREKLISRAGADLRRFPRLIDAADFDDLIVIICNPKLFPTLFSRPLSGRFNFPVEVVRTILERVVPVRNKLAHANPISNAEVITLVSVCSDITISLEAYYAEQGMLDDFKAPTILRSWDSLGHVEHAIANSDAGRAFNYSDTPDGLIRCGDEVAIEIEVDAVGDPDVTIYWSTFRGGQMQVGGEPRFIFRPEVADVALMYQIAVRVMSSKGWHRHGWADDAWNFYYRIAPPLTGF